MSAVTHHVTNPSTTSILWQTLAGRQKAGRKGVGTAWYGLFKRRQTATANERTDRGAGSSLLAWIVGSFGAVQPSVQAREGAFSMTTMMVTIGRRQRRHDDTTTIFRGDEASRRQADFRRPAARAAGPSTPPRPYSTPLTSLPLPLALALALAHAFAVWFAESWPSEVRPINSVVMS